MEEKKAQRKKPSKESYNCKWRIILDALVWLLIADTFFHMAKQVELFRETGAYDNTKFFWSALVSLWFWRKIDLTHLSMIEIHLLIQLK